MIRLRAFGIGLALTLLAGCGEEAPTAPAAEARPVFKVLAGSELKDMEPLLAQFAEQQHVSVKLDYTGTLDAVDRLQARHDYDAVWVSHAKYLQLVPAVRSQVQQAEKTMYSRVVLGVKPEVAQALGWQSGKVGWQDVIQATASGKFRFAMTNPTGSNTGFVALVGLAAELSGKGDALTVADVPSDRLTALFRGHSLTSGSSGALGERFAANPSAADGMVNYESVVRGMAQRGLPLDVIVPKEGVITADYPLLLLKQSQQAATYQALITWLRRPDTQKRIAADTHRMPLTGADDDTVVNELPFPASQAVIDAILRGFLDQYAKPITTYLVLDHSGSMEGERIAAMKAAVTALTSGDGSTSGRFAALRARETLVLAPFSSAPDPLRPFTLPDTAQANQATLADVSQAVLGLQAGGGTAIYDTLAQVYPRAQQELKAGGRNVAIILLSDGLNTNGEPFPAFAQRLRDTGPPQVPIFPILFGEADTAEMKQLADLSGGQTFDARSAILAEVFKKIRTYQ